MTSIEKNLQTIIDRQKSVKAVNSPQVKKEKICHIHLLVESDCTVLQNTFYDKASGSALFLI